MMMNFYLPLRGHGIYHCSANAEEAGDAVRILRLSGTGKTTTFCRPKKIFNW